MFLGLGIIIAILAACAIWFGYAEEVTIAKILGYAGVVIGIVLIVAYFFTAEGARTVKSWSSNTSGGLVRTVDVYDLSGNLLKEYTGKIDVQDTEYGNKVLFDLDGKRTIIYNATVIVQEK